MDKDGFKWDELLEQIHRQNVIPVIGQGLYWVRTDENKEVLLYNYLAEKLAQTMGYPSPEQSNHAFSKMVFRYLKDRPNDYLGLRQFLIEKLAGMYPIPAGPLWKLARIKPFSLFINTTYDHFLEHTLNSIRNYPTEALYHTYREKRTGRITSQKIDILENSRSSLLLNIYGSAANNMVPAYTENDILETIVEFKNDMIREPRNPLFQALKKKSLLFICCGYDDWLYRFFIRTIANEPFQITKDPLTWKFIADDFYSINYDKMKLFLKAYGSEVFYSGESQAFIDLLFYKMSEKYSQDIIPPEKFPEDVFISFHGADRTAASRLAANLREDGIKVWLDERTLKPEHPGDEIIAKAIDKCWAFIPLISKNTKKFRRNDDHVIKFHIREWEWAYAQHVKGKNPRVIIPVKIDDTDWMYEPFKKTVFIYIPGGNREGDYEKLRNRLLEVGDPLKMPPLEIVKKGKTALDNYFQSLHQDEKIPVNEVKVLILGEGGVGKTSLVKRLLGKNFDENEKQTHGININLWKFKNKMSENEVRTHIWDFGGQEIMHATHQFFLSKRSFYILVLEKKNENKAEYWFKYIESFGGESPVLVVLNKVDKNPVFKIKQDVLKKKYKTVTNFFPISCKTKEGFDTFLPAFKDSLFQVELLKTNWPSNWFNVKVRLENSSESFISYEEYRSICVDEKITDDSTQTTLLGFLHDLGVILHYQDIDLEDTYVLNPKWVTEAVYKIINSKKFAKRKGILKLDSLKDILRKKKETDHEYPTNKHRYIIQLMKKFELCYEIDKDQILIPDLLEEEECKFDFDYDAALKFVFKYDFLPKSVMHRFIVRIHRYIKDELQWCMGVVLKDETFQSTAVIKVEEDRKISIYVNGEQKQYYSVFIRHTLKEINQSFEKLKVIEEGPSGGEPNVTVSNTNTKSPLHEVMVNTNVLQDVLKTDDLSTIFSNIYGRIKILDDLEDLIRDESTYEKEIHRILEVNLWLLGTEYSRLASDEQLKRVVEDHLGKKYKGENPGKRPDLLLFEDINRSYLLIELKRPSYTLRLKDEIQALKYRQELKAYLHDIKFNVLLIGGRIGDNNSPHDLRPEVKYLSYTVLIRNAKKNLEWMISDLKSKKNGKCILPS